MAKIKPIQDAKLVGLGKVQPDLLLLFEPFKALDAHQRLLLAERVKAVKIPQKVRLFNAGDNDIADYFLLKGSVELIAADGKTYSLSSKDDAAKRQIARLRPRQYTVNTTEECEVLLVDGKLVRALTKGQVSRMETLQEEYSVAYGVTEMDYDDDYDTADLMQRFRDAVEKNTLVLPSLPEVAMRVRRLLADPSTNADGIAKAINTDPAIAAKLLRAANSPLFLGAAQCETTRNAIVRLGLETTRQLVVSFAVRDLFRSSNALLKKHMLTTWQHSLEVAAISFVVARMVKLKDFPAEEVMLAGLLHDIGSIAILSFLHAQDQLFEDAKKMRELLAKLRGEASVAILKHWNFNEDIIESIGLATDWLTEAPSPAPTLTDVIQIATLHSYLHDRHGAAGHLPRIDQVPAFSRLPLGDITPELTIRILDEAQEQIEEAKRLLNQ